jgi:hypothetical protein
MKFGHGVLTAALALVGAAVSTSAFTAPPQTQHAHHFMTAGLRTSTSSTSSNMVRFTGRRHRGSRQWLAESDEDEDHDNDNDNDEPLAKGVDSVSWLPSVLETKKVDMGTSASAGKVSIYEYTVLSRYAT